MQRTEFAPPCVRGRQRPRPVPIAVQLVPRIRHRRHSEQSGIESLLERVRHGAPLLAGGPLTAIGRSVQAHHVRPKIRMSDQSSDIGAERQALERGDVFDGRGPRLVRIDGFEHMISRQRLDPTEQIRDVDRSGVERRQRTVPQQNRRDPVPDGLFEARADEHLRVVMGMDVHEARRDPLAGGVDHLGRRAHLERCGGHGPHDTVDDAHIGSHSGTAGPVVDGAAGPVVDGAAGDDDVERNVRVQCDLRHSVRPI